jgi:hypothetical protein
VTCPRLRTRARPRPPTPPRLCTPDPILTEFIPSYCGRRIYFQTDEKISSLFFLLPLLYFLLLFDAARMLLRICSADLPSPLHCAPDTRQATPATAAPATTAATAATAVTSSTWAPKYEFLLRVLLFYAHILFVTDGLHLVQLTLHVQLLADAPLRAAVAVLARGDDVVPVEKCRRRNVRRKISIWH